MTFWYISSDKSQRSKLDLSDFANNLWSDFTPFICSGRIGFTPEKIHDAIHLGQLLNNINDYGKMGQTWLFRPCTRIWSLDLFNQVHLLAVDQYHPGSCIYIYIYITQCHHAIILENWQKHKKLTFFGSFGPWKLTFISMPSTGSCFTAHCYILKEAPYQIKTKQYY